ncbi:hypothetical protein C2845_PM13G16610 [Panicum miliaceum]|uniref:Uncharacterized protein n=1 Tax=Panicum miliaceum TaxID=4540 RepID=A0A3L6RMP1_PANMI|nr:hypothetical protein C2845_PM13G16610 [Panicum miliaceum]
MGRESWARDDYCCSMDRTWHHVYHHQWNSSFIITGRELTAFHEVYTQRIRGDHGGAAAVDISPAFLHSAVEARIRVVLSKVPDNGGCRIELSDGSVEKPGVLMNKFVVAAVFNGPLVLSFEVEQGAGGVIHRFCAFPVKAHCGNH